MRCALWISGNDFYTYLSAPLYPRTFWNKGAYVCPPEWKSRGRRDWKRSDDSGCFAAIDI